MNRRRTTPAWRGLAAVAAATAPLLLGTPPAAAAPGPVVTGPVTGGNGTTVPLSAARLAALYPSHARFAARWSADTLTGVARGFLRPADAAELISAAAKSSIS
jgi:Alpha/beta hydrolase domain